MFDGLTKLNSDTNIWAVRHVCRTLVGEEISGWSKMSRLGYPWRFVLNRKYTAAMEAMESVQTAIAWLIWHWWKLKKVIVLMQVLEL